MGMSLPGNILLPAGHLEIVIVMETNKPWYKAILGPYEVSYLYLRVELQR